MIVEPAELPGVLKLRAMPVRDERGYFARTFCTRELAQAGIGMAFPQHGVAQNAIAGTVRGLHYTADAHPEAKIVRCTSGAIYDVVVDLRRDSPAYGTWAAFELRDPLEALYVPHGFAHGYQTLEDDTHVSYLLSAFYDAQHARGIRYDDPVLAIRWPLAVSAVSERDRGLPALR